MLFEWIAHFETRDEAVRAYKEIKGNGVITSSHLKNNTIRIFTDENVNGNNIRVILEGFTFTLEEPEDYQDFYTDINVLFAKINLSSLYPSGLYSDAVIVVDNTEFRVHKNILSCASKYFKSMFEYHNHDRFEIKDISPEGLDRVFRVIYDGLVMEDDILEVVLLLKYFEVRGVNYKYVIETGIYKHFNNKEYLIEVLNRLFPYGYPNYVVEKLELIDKYSNNS